MIRSTALSLSLLAAALATVPASASAQWQWRDANGHMVYSDVPPPPSVTTIVKAPGQFAGEFRKVDAAPASAPGAPAKPADAKPAAAPALTAEQAFQKRRTERLQAAAAEARKENEANERAVHCAELETYAMGLQQGGRAGVFNADGSVQPLAGEQRQAEILKTNASIAKDCS